MKIEQIQKINDVRNKFESFDLKFKAELINEYEVKTKKIIQAISHNDLDFLRWLIKKNILKWN